MSTGLCLTLCDQDNQLIWHFLEILLCIAVSLGSPILVPGDRSVIGDNKPSIAMHFPEFRVSFFKMFFENLLSFYCHNNLQHLH